MESIAKNKITTSYLTFIMAEENYAVKADNILEVLYYENITIIPNSETFIVGIINFRSNILTVTNICEKFNIKTNFTENIEAIIVFELLLHNNPLKVGVVVNKVNKVIEVASEDIIEAPEFGSQFPNEYIEGLISVGGDFYRILNIHKIFNNKL